MENIMIRIQDNPKFRQALERCKADHPRVKRLTADTVQVYGKGGQYVVTFAEPKLGLKLAACTCPAGQKGQICKHLPAAMGAPAIPVAVSAPMASKSRIAEYERRNAVLVKPTIKGETYGGIDT